MKPVQVVAAVAIFSLSQLSAVALQDGGASYQERDFLTRVRRLTVEGKRAGEGYWSPDGKRLVFQSEREPGNPFYQIYTLDLTSGDVNRISPGIGKTTCAFFRPGHRRDSSSPRRISIRSRSSCRTRNWRSAPRARNAATRGTTTREMDIFAYSEKTGAMKRLTTARGYDAEASYSPDGQWIVFSSMRDAYNRTLSDDGEEERSTRTRATSPRSTSCGRTAPARSA